MYKKIQLSLLVLALAGCGSDGTITYGEISTAESGESAAIGDSGTTPTPGTTTPMPANAGTATAPPVIAQPTPAPTAAPTRTPTPSPTPTPGPVASPSPAPSPAPGATPAPISSGALAPAPTAANQTAGVGRALPNAVAVVVRNSAGAPQVGVTVNFAVSGGGSLQRTAATSDGNGFASAGIWTLGPGAGTQTVTASATGFSPTVISATATLASTDVPTVTRTVFMGGLANPWDLAFTPDGAMLYTERSRGLSVRLPDGSTRALFRPADLVVEGQSGMLGLDLDPNFASNRTLYIYMSSRAGGATDNRVIALTVDGGYSAVGSRRDIVTGIAYSGGAHSGGRLRFGPDNLLYITTGDNLAGPLPQSLRSLGGKVLRVDRDGNPAAGNNTPGGGNPLIYAFGFRNPQGIDFRPGTGQPFIAEHGPSYQDEITPLRAGGNGGWDPRCADGTSYCGYDGRTQMTDLARFPDALRPAWRVDQSSGMAGSAFLAGPRWRAWDGAYVVAFLNGTRLEVVTLNAAGTAATGNVALFREGTRLRTPVLGPDGALYLTTDNKPGGDEIWRIAPN